jgi:xanthine dehydrogenase/oxidase
LNLATAILLLISFGHLSTHSPTISPMLQANRWKKRGLSVVPMKYGVDWRAGDYNCLLSVYHGDATVVVQHGGIEMGQGIDMKVL